MTKHKGFHLYLTPEQARALAKVCGAVGGSPRGPRGYIQDIAEKLNQRGFHWTTTPFRTTGGVYFE